MAASNIVRGGLPAPVADAIIAGMTAESAIMKLARRITVPGRGVAVPVVLGDAQGEWVAEAGEKPVSPTTFDHLLLTPYKIAVIDLYSKELVRDERAFYEAMMQRLPGSLAKVFDSTVSGATAAPGANFTQLNANTGSFGTATAYADLVDAMSGIAQSGGQLNGYAVSPYGQGALLGATDQTGRPLFSAGTEAGTLQPILGGIAQVGAGIDGSIIGIAGDWTQAVWGTVAGVEIDISEEASVKIGNDTLNLWQHNLVGVKAEIEVGFVANENVFVALTEESSE